ncbi:MAG: 5-bromo-4-chloroindolyl phosphate hydrolysis family protein [Eubacteriales bacterium]
MNENNDKFTGRTADFQKKIEKVVNTVTDPSLGQNITQSVSQAIQSLSSESAVKKHNKRALRKMKEHGDEFLAIGITFSLVFLVASITTASSQFAAIPALATLGFGFMTAVGFAQKNQGKRMMKYWNILGESSQFSIQKLAQLSGEPKNKIYKDLDIMVEKGLFLQAFVDRNYEVLVLKNIEEYIEHYRSAVPEPLPVAEIASPEAQTFLTEIRAINQAIYNPKLSAQIHEIETLIGKISAFQEANQNKERELHSFFSYYIPTTLKILRNYAQLEAQNIEGENISKAKAEIEAMMEKVVEGFEKQLDQLFRTDSMDIAADIAVLEQMFEKDGLTGNSPKLKINPSSNTPNPLDIDLKF